MIQKIKYDTECEFISCWTIWPIPQSSTSMTSGIGGQNTIKKHGNFNLRYLSLKFVCDQVTKGYLPHKSIFCHKVALNVSLMNFSIWKKNCFVVKISKFLRFCKIHKFPNLWHHHRHCCMMEVTLKLISFESYMLL